jgi:hypothetical protein
MVQEIPGMVKTGLGAAAHTTRTLWQSWRGTPRAVVEAKQVTAAVETASDVKPILPARFYETRKKHFLHEAGVHREMAEQTTHPGSQQFFKALAAYQDGLARSNTEEGQQLMRNAITTADELSPK